MQVFQTISELRTATTIPADGCAKVLGYWAAGDGGGGDFYWDAASHAADNDGTIFQIGSLPGRWKRIYSGQANVRWFGAKCDEFYTDDTAAIKKAIAACNDVIIDGISLITDTIVLRENDGQNQGTSFRGVSKATSGLRAGLTKAQIAANKDKASTSPDYTKFIPFDMLHVPGGGNNTISNVTVTDLNLSFYGADFTSTDGQHYNFGDKAVIRVLPGQTIGSLIIDNIDILGTYQDAYGGPVAAYKGIGILLETAYTGNNFWLQYYIDFARFTNITMRWLNSGICLNNLIQYTPTTEHPNKNFINGNIFDGIIIDNSTNPIRIHTDGPLADQKQGWSQISSNYFKNIILQYKHPTPAPGVKMEGGTDNVFDIIHFDATQSYFDFSDQTFGNSVVNPYHTNKNQVTGLGQNILADNSRVKASAVFKGQNSVTVTESENIASIIRTAPGIYVVTFKTPMPDANYKISVSSDSLFIDRNFMYCFSKPELEAAAKNGFTIYGWNISTDGTTHYNDVHEVDFVVL